jgi:hypothetical protein
MQQMEKLLLFHVLFSMAGKCEDMRGVICLQVSLEGVRLLLGVEWEKSGWELKLLWTLKINFYIEILKN